MTDKIDKIDLDDVQKVVRDLAKHKPDFIYHSPDKEYGTCMYWHKDENAPGCIYGHALTRLGVDVITNNFEDTSIYSVLGKITGASVPGWFVYVQKLQDSGVSWGDAVAYADREFERIHQN